MSGLFGGLTVTAGTILSYGGFTVPDGFLECDGSAFSRTIYADLFTVITDTQSGTRTSGSAVITGLSDTSRVLIGTDVEGTGIPAGTMILSVDSATQVTLDANATSSGTDDVRFLPYGGGDGSTTFNVPNHAIGTEVNQAATKPVFSVGVTPKILVPSTVLYRRVYGAFELDPSIGSASRINVSVETGVGTDLFNEYTIEGVPAGGGGARFRGFMFTVEGGRKYLFNQASVGDVADFERYGYDDVYHVPVDTNAISIIKT